MKRLEVLKSSFTTAAGRVFLLALGLGGASTFGAQAQTQPGKGKPRGTIQDAEIEIVKDRVNTLPEATRNFEKIKLAPPPKPNRQVTYTYPDFRLPATRLNPSVQVLTVAQEELTPLTGNYVKLGVGNYGSVYGRAHLHSTRNDQYSYGLDVRHNSSNTGPIDGQNSGVSQTSAALTGEYYKGATTFGAALDVARERYNFYGYDRSKLLATPESDALKQTFTRFGVRAYARNRAADAPLQYEVGVGYRYSGDHFDVSENNLLIDGKAGYALSETSRLTLDAQGSFISDKQPLGLSGNATRSRNFFQATPAYELTGKTGLTLTLGATLGYSGDALNGVGKGMINPAVRVGYAIVPEKFQLYGGLGGAIQRVTRYDLSQENPWLAPGQTLADTHAGPTVYAGFTATPISGLELAARATFGRSRNLYFYRNSVADTSKFDLAYDSTTINVANVHAEALYSASEKVRVGVKADYNYYGVKSLAQAYGRPAFIGTLYGTYNATDKLLLGANFYYYSANYGVGREPRLDYPGYAVVDHQTNAVVDLNLRADYRITPKFSIFAMGNNLANRKYQRYLNYQSQGINVIGGLTYSF
ncbi:TonB-dependent receptor [Hymenobacter arcticus]